MAGVLTHVCRRLGGPHADRARAAGLLLGCGVSLAQRVVLPVRGSAWASMVLLQVFALVRVASLRVHQPEVDSDQALLK